jgi:cobalt-zinc-cadmium efflux system outer membrane protein
MAQARARQQKADLELRLLQAVIEKEITNASNRVKAAQQALRLFGGGILPLAESHLKLTQQAYEQGQAGILDVMEAQRRFSETRLGYLEARYDFNVALAEAERVIGTSLTGPSAPVR